MYSDGNGGWVTEPAVNATISLECAGAWAKGWRRAGMVLLAALGLLAIFLVASSTKRG